MLPRIWLAVTASAFVGWLAYLAVLNYQTRTAPRPIPLIVRVQAEEAPILIVGRLQRRDDVSGTPAKPNAVVVEILAVSQKDRVGLEALQKGQTPIPLPDLPNAIGFVGDGDYLLALTPTPKGGFQLWEANAPGWEKVKMSVTPWTSALGEQVADWRARKS